MNHSYVQDFSNRVYGSKAISHQLDMLHSFLSSVIDDDPFVRSLGGVAWWETSFTTLRQVISQRSALLQDPRGPLLHVTFPATSLLGIGLRLVALALSLLVFACCCWCQEDGRTEQPDIELQPLMDTDNENASARE